MRQLVDDGSQRIVGILDTSVHELSLPTHSLAPDEGLYLTALAVLPEFRRRGIATALVETSVGPLQRTDPGWTRNPKQSLHEIVSPPPQKKISGVYVGACEPTLRRSLRARSPETETGRGSRRARS